MMEAGSNTVELLLYRREMARKKEKEGNGVKNL
jgi:hypothetical protein